MSLNYNYLTKSFLLLKYRDVIAVSMISTWVMGKFMQYNSTKSDHEFIFSRLYTHDESDIEFAETHNMTDGAVRRNKII